MSAGLVLARDLVQSRYADHALALDRISAEIIIFVDYKLKDINKFIMNPKNPNHLLSMYWFFVCSVFSGEGSHQSGSSEDRTPGAMARAITVHADTKKVMYFA